MNRGKLFVRTGVALAAAGIGGLVLVQPAAAHATGFSKTRSGCHYSGGVNSAHSFAWTQKDSGGCSGHAWLRVTFTDGSSSGDVHSAGRAEVYGPIRYAWHKTQANEGWVRSH